MEFFLYQISIFNFWQDIEINDSCLIDNSPIDRNLPGLIDREETLLYIEAQSNLEPSIPTNQSIRAIRARENATSIDRSSSPPICSQPKRKEKNIVTCR
jgi:hypothetical protein